MTESTLTHLFVASYLIAFVLGWFAHTRPLACAGGFAALGFGFAASLPSAWLSWNGHDWIEDGLSAERYLGIAAAAVALVFLCSSLSPRPASRS